MASYFLLSVWFPKPPCDPEQSDFPSPILTLVRLINLLETEESLSAGLHTLLSFAICLRTCFARELATPGSLSRCSLSSSGYRAPKRGLPSRLPDNATSKVKEWRVILGIPLAVSTLSGIVSV